MKMNELETVFQYIDAHKEQYIQELKDFAAIGSTASQPEEREKARQFIEARLQKAGLASKRLDVPGGNAMITGAKAGDSPKTVLFYNHYDVVEPGDPKKWSSGTPFTVTEKDGFLYGRGVSDDKGPLLSRIQMLEAILNATGKLPVSVRYLYEGDEESGSPSMLGYVKKNADTFRQASEADVCFWENGRRQGDGGPWARYGVRGACKFNLYIKTAAKDVHGRMGAVVPSASWRLIWALGTLKAPDGRVQIEGFYDNVVQPTEHELEVLKDFPYDEQREKDKLQLDHFVNNVTGLELKKRMYFEPSLSVCGLEAGQMYIKPRGIVPHEASATVSCYLVANQNPERIAKLLRQHLDKHGFSDIQVDYIDGTYPVKTSMEIPETECLEKAALTAYGKPLVKEVTQLGAGPAIAFRWVQPDLKIIGIGPGNTNGNHHAPDENMRIDDYIRSMKFTAAFLYEYGK